MPRLDDEADCRNCGLRIRFLGQWINTWVHVLTQSMWCDLSATARARP